MKGSVALLAVFSIASCTASPSHPLSSNPRVFRCSPGTVAHGDTLVLEKDLPGSQELAVRRPGSITPHFLVVGSPPPQMQPLMSPEELGARREVRVPVSQLAGLEWRVGAAQERIFTLPGTYRFILGPNLESEEPGYTCDVEFQPGTKRDNSSSGPEPIRGAGARPHRQEQGHS